jgi:hypothetical protein
MNTDLYATKDRPCGVHTGRCHMDGERYRRELRAALHELRQRLEEGPNGASRVKVVVTAGPAPSTKCRIRGNLFQKLRSFYTVFTSCVL